MKTKRFAFLLACIICLTVILLLYGDPSYKPSIQKIVSETQRFANWKTDQVKEATSDTTPEDKYLKQLGFHGNHPNLYPKKIWSNTTLPVFTAIVLPSDTAFVHPFLNSFQRFFINHVVIIYDLGLNPSDLLKVSGLCNTSYCILRTFDFESYPSHVRTLQFFAFRPLIIQEILNEAGAVIMMDIQYVFTSGDIHNILYKAEKEGILSWPMNQPTSTLTHPRMFDYFNTKQQKFFFHRMVLPRHIIVYNTNSIHFGVMFPWVKCALVPNCIAPIGAQNSGCRFDKKPLYRYSGCHRYDTSALNVVLGLMFDFSSSHYSAKDEEKFFRVVDIDNEFLILSNKNTTISSDSN